MSDKKIARDGAIIPPMQAHVKKGAPIPTMQPVQPQSGAPIPVMQQAPTPTPKPAASTTGKPGGK